MKNIFCKILIFFTLSIAGNANADSPERKKDDLNSMLPNIENTPPNTKKYNSNINLKLNLTEESDFEKTDVWNFNSKYEEYKNSITGNQKEKNVHFEYGKKIDYNNNKNGRDNRAMNKINQQEKEIYDFFHPGEDTWNKKQFEDKLDNEFENFKIIF